MLSFQTMAAILDRGQRSNVTRSYSEICWTQISKSFVFLITAFPTLFCIPELDFS